MKKFIQLSALMMLLFCSDELLAQKSMINATITNSRTGEKISSASVLIQERSEGSYSDDKGNVSISFAGSYPVKLLVSSIGYQSREVILHHKQPSLNIQLSPSSVMGEEVVVSPNRMATSFVESPVTIERMTSASIRNGASPDFYQSAGKLKGVDVTTSALLFHTVSTRGFNGSGNLRLNQFLDGMDNQAPGLNFSVGNLLGMSELDVESVELLSGASSALYGSGGLNGTLLMNSKSPFKYKGFSAQVKEGVMHVDGKQRTASPYHDFSFRFGKSFHEKFAFKINAQIIKANDWEAQDRSNLQRTNVLSNRKIGDRASDPNYDGVNVYGDELNIDMYSTSAVIIYQATEGYKEYYKSQTGVYPTPQQIDQFLSNHPDFKYIYLAMKNHLIPKKRVSRTGYDEKDLVDYETYNVKLSGGLYYNINPSTEISIVGYWGKGTTVYTGADRYSLKGVHMGQYKAEIKNKNWFLRAFTTQENAGEAFNTTALASYINESWKKSDRWFPEYLSYFSGALLSGNPEDAAHAFARSKADEGRLLPGTAGFKTEYDRIRQTPIVNGGALFLDKSDLWQGEGQLNLSDKIRFAKLIIGGNYKTYLLNSEGTLFADTAGIIKIPEWGAYAQLQRSILKDKLSFTASGRYDKSKNFEGVFTPRLTALLKIAEDQNLRFSYQTAFRFPVTQDQYINLFTGTTYLIGALPAFGTMYHFEDNPLYTAESIGKYRESNNGADLQKAAFEQLHPEKVKSFEAGYKSIIGKKLMIDFYVYQSTYTNLIGRIAAGQPKSAATALRDLPSSFTTKNFTYAQNLSQAVHTHGGGIGIEYKPGKNYQIALNASGDKMGKVPEGFISFYNTPAFRYNIGMANPDLWRGFGFNVNYRWQDKVDWQGTFGSGTISAYGTMDAQISYKLSKMKTLLKIGGSNIFNNYYQSAFGNPQIGGLYYVSVGYNVF